MSTPLFFHVDLDAFFASVEQLDNPELRGKPVIVGGSGRRGVVSTCSYEARAFGVHSAMPMMQARRCCPQGIFLPVRMKRYVEKSKEVMDIFRQFSPDVHRLSIDEAFLDMSGMTYLWKDAHHAGTILKQTIYKQTGLHASIGAGSNKYIAKIASGKAKPDGLLIVPQGSEAAFMETLPLKDIWGVGEKTRTRLIHAGLATTQAIIRQEESILQMILGTAAGSFVYHAVRGDTARIFNEERKSRSVSTERTFEYDAAEKEEIEDILFYLTAELMYRMLDEHITGSTVRIKIRYADFTTVTAQQSGTDIRDSADLYQRVCRLFFAKYNPAWAVRLIGVGVDIQEPGCQLELFGAQAPTKKRKAEEAVRQISKKNRSVKIVPARLLKDTK